MANLNMSFVQDLSPEVVPWFCASLVQYFMLVAVHVNVLKIL